jgi:alkylhydroperoxidase family enzyme
MIIIKSENGYDVYQPNQSRFAYVDRDRKKLIMSHVLSRIAIPSLDAAPEASKPTLDAVHKQLGTVPNLFRLIGNSPTILTAFASFQGALSKTLDVKTRERIALAVAQVNGCDYCLSAHTYLGLNLVS